MDYWFSKHIVFYIVTKLLDFSYTKWYNCLSSSFWLVKLSTSFCSKHYIFVWFWIVWSVSFLERIWLSPKDDLWVLNLTWTTSFWLTYEKRTLTVVPFLKTSMMTISIIWYRGVVILSFYFPYTWCLFSWFRQR